MTLRLISGGHAEWYSTKCCASGPTNLGLGTILPAERVVLLQTRARVGA
jgi:hypothetical protein